MVIKITAPPFDLKKCEGMTDEQIKDYVDEELKKDGQRIFDAMAKTFGVTTKSPPG